MDDMALAINHNVGIVPILDLKEVAHQRVGGHRADKVFTGFTEPFGCFFPKLMHKIFIQT